MGLKKQIYSLLSILLILVLSSTFLQLKSLSEVSTLLEHDKESSLKVGHRVIRWEHDFELMRENTRGYVKDRRASAKKKNINLTNRAKNSLSEVLVPINDTRGVELFKAIHKKFNSIDNIQSEIFREGVPEKRMDVLEEKLSQNTQMIEALKSDLIIYNFNKSRNIVKKNIFLINKFSTHVLVMALFVSLCLIMFVYFFNKSMFKPLQQLSEGIDVLDSGNLEHIIDLPKSSHLSHLSKAINRMTFSIRERNAEIELSKKELEQIVELRTDELQNAIDMLKMVDDSKSQFLANMSHEIRTPMNGVLGMVELLNTTKLNEEQLDMLSTVKSCGDALMTILNDILDYSKICAGKLDLEKLDFDLKKLVDTSIQLFSFQAKSKGLSLTFEIDKSVPLNLKGDVTRISQILFNFLSNAIKFTDEGDVHLMIKSTEIENKSSRVEFHIRDTGIGIAKEEQHRLFTAFSQADNTMARKFGGTGLGLAISSKLIELMSGSLIFTSKKGLGTEFTFFLPLETSAINFQTGKSERVICNTIVDSFSSGSPHSILLVEDNLINQKVAKLILKKLGYSCDIASNGKEAVDIICEKGSGYYSLVFMDLQMPVLDGISATKEIIKLFGEESPVIVAMTANAFKEDEQNCYKCGMSGFLAKPIKIDQLKDALSRFSDNQIKENAS